jgi:hypothetical protein
MIALHEGRVHNEVDGFRKVNPAVPLFRNGSPVEGLGGLDRMIEREDVRTPDKEICGRALNGGQERVEGKGKE